MRTHRLRVVATLTALLAFSPSAPGSGGEPPPVVQNVVFQQIDWLEAPNVPLQKDSVWGQVSFTYTPGRTTWYLNIAAARPGVRRESWFLRNLPLFGERTPRPRQEAVYLDLRSLGLSDGQDWAAVQYALTVDSTIRKKAPRVQRNRTLPVGVRAWHQVYCLGSTPVERLVPGAPLPMLINSRPKNRLLRRVSRPVQEEVPGDCVAGSFARSLDWLNQTHGSDKTPTAQEIYEGLVTAGVSREDDENDNGTALDEWIVAKNVYAAHILGLDIETTIWDGADLVPPIDGVDEENGDFLKWLEREMKAGADVEVGYTFSGGRHLMMITHLYFKDQDAYVIFREDEVAGDDTEGDRREYRAKIFKGADGEYHFLTDEMTIAIAISEKARS